MPGNFFNFLHIYVCSVTNINVWMTDFACGLTEGSVKFSKLGNEKFTKPPWGKSCISYRTSVCFIGEKSSKSLGFNATQMTSLVRLLPLMLDPLTRFGSDKYAAQFANGPVFELLIQMVELQRLLYAPSFSRECLLTLKRKIATHLELFVTTFPDAKMIYKQHLLQHIAEVCLTRTSIIHSF